MSSRTSRMDKLFIYLGKCRDRDRNIISRGEVALNRGKDFENSETAEDMYARRSRGAGKCIEEVKRTQAMLRDTLETRAKLTSKLQDVRAKLNAARSKVAASPSGEFNRLIAEMEASMPANDRIVSLVEEERKKMEIITEALQQANKEEEELRETIHFLRSALPLIIVPAEEHVEIGALSATGQLIEERKVCRNDCDQKTVDELWRFIASS